MKIRNGFVSNSSSSSFIVAIKIKDSTRCECCGRSDPDFEKACFERQFRETELTASGCEEVIKVLKDTEECYLDMSESESELVYELLEIYKREDEWKVMMFDIDYGDVSSRNILLNLLNSKNATIVYDEERKYERGWL